MALSTLGDIAAIYLATKTFFGDFSSSQPSSGRPLSELTMEGWEHFKLRRNIKRLEKRTYSTLESIDALRPKFRGLEELVVDGRVPNDVAVDFVRSRRAEVDQIREAITALGHFGHDVVEACLGVAKEGPRIGEPDPPEFRGMVNGMHELLGIFEEQVERWEESLRVQGIGYDADDSHPRSEQV